MQESLKIAWCPLCNQGWVEIVRDINTKVLFVCCNECENEWNSPKDINISGKGTHDMYGKVDIPTYSEICEIGWDSYIINN